MALVCMLFLKSIAETMWTKKICKRKRAIKEKERNKGIRILTMEANTMKTGTV